MASLSAVRRSAKRAKEDHEKNRVPSATVLPPALQQTKEALAIAEELNLEPALVEAIQIRLERYERAATDLKFRAEEWEKCRKSPAYFVDNWVWTYDPRRDPATIPFNLFPKQSEFFDWLGDRIRNKEVGLVEKSRDMGMTWMCVVFAVWQLIFVFGSKVTFGSRKSDLVDRIGDPDSIFEKMRMVLQTLPLWLRPNEYSDGELKIINKDNGNTCTGEAGDQMGRGGRSRLYFVDEAAFIERAKRVDAAISQNSEVRIYVSTPNGAGNEYARKRFSGNFPVFTFHWKDDPRKSENWYAKQKRELDPVVLAQEVDLDYHASQSGILIPSLWVRAAVDLRISPLGAKVAGLDVANEGRDLNVLIIRRGPVVRLQDIESWSEGTTYQTAHKAANICRYKQVKHLNFDCNGVGAGVHGDLEVMDLPFSVRGVNGGEGVPDTYLKEFNRPACDVFRNKRAEMFWIVRRRFEKTYEHVNKLAEYPDSELISIPNHPELILQLSQPLWRFNDRGQIVIESKEEMLKRDVKSPDFADAIAYAFCGVDLETEFGWMSNA